MKIIDDSKIKKANKESDEDLEKAKRLPNVEWIRVHRNSEGIIGILEIHKKQQNKESIEEV